MSLFEMFSKVLPGRGSLGLEITDTSMKLVELAVRSGEQPVVRTVAFDRLPPNAVEDGKLLQPAVVTHTLQNLLRRTGVKTKRVHLIAPSQMLMVRFLKMPDLPLKALAKVMEFEVKHHIHLPFERPYYDFMKLNGTNDKDFKSNSPASLPERSGGRIADHEAAAAAENGYGGFSKPSVASLFEDKGQEEAPVAESESPECDVMLVAAPKELIDDYKKAVEAAGLRPITMEFKAMSLFRLIEHEVPETPAQTLLVLDMNETAADISIFHEGLLKITRSVPVSFAAGRVSQASAQREFEERLFAEFESGSELDNAEHAAEELVHELERLMNFYRYTLNNRTQQFHSLFVSGDIEGFDAVCAVLDERFALPVVPIRPQAFDFADSRLAEPLLRCAVPLGLALRRERS